MKLKLIEALAMAGLALATAEPIPCLAQGSRQAPNRKAEQGPRKEQRQEQREAKQPQHHAGDWLRRYKDLPAGQQANALENDPQFKRLAPERQQQLRQRLQHFSSLPPQQQDRILNRMETWEHLTPEQKQQARQLYSQIKDLPPERRRMMQTAIRGLRQMPPEQRQQVLESERFKSMFSPKERDLLTGISRLPLASPEGGQNEPPEE